MSLFLGIHLTCPSCGEDFEADAVESVNADRRPDLRTAILDETFQVETCPSCGHESRIDPRFNYLDIGRGQWISAFASSEIVNWEAQEDVAGGAFSIAYGEKAGSAAREIGKSLSARLVFGWPAMREKILLNELGLDDVGAELTKLTLIAGLPNFAIEPGVDLRVTGGDDTKIALTRQRAETGEAVETLTVPRDLFDEIAADLDSFGAQRSALAAGPFVDLQRLYLAEAKTPGTSG